MVLVLPALLVLLHFQAFYFDRNNEIDALFDTPMDSDSGSPIPTYRVAHFGNSIQYYNDCPRFLEKMLLATALGKVIDLDDPQRNRHVKSDSCLKGGATLPSLWEKGNGMATKFSSRPDSILQGDDGYDIGKPTVADLLQSQEGRYWDFVVVNDHTQSPVRSERKNESEVALKTHYLQAIGDGMEASNNESKNTTIVFVQTMAYKSPVKDSADLGSFDEFTEALAKGYDEYVALAEEYASSRFPDQNSLKATVAPLGRAYQVIREEHFEFWSNNMYANDDFHPSPHGTLLEACILHCFVTKQKFNLFADSGGGDGDNVMDDWWKRARYMQPLTYPNGDPQEPLRIPTRKEAMYLNDIAYRVYLERLEKEAGNNRKL